MKKNLQNLTIVLADDHPMNLVLMTRILEDEGAVILGAVNGQEVMNLLQTTSGIDIALLDLQMPVMDGLECAMRIRQQAGTYSKMPLFAISAGISDAEKAASFEAGFDFYLLKPLKREAVYNALLSTGFLKAEAAPNVMESDEEVRLDYLAMATQNDGDSAREIVFHAAESVPGLLCEADAAVVNGRYLDAASILHKTKGLIGILEFKRLMEMISEAEQSLKNSVNSNNGMQFDFDGWQNEFTLKLKQAEKVVSTW